MKKYRGAKAQQKKIYICSTKRQKTGILLAKCRIVSGESHNMYWQDKNMRSSKLQNDMYRVP